MRVSRVFLVTTALFGIGTSLLATGSETSEANRGWSLDLSSTQQEVSASRVDIYAPQFVKWGQLGVSYGTKNYYWADAENNQKKMPNGELALQWKISSPVSRIFVPSAVFQLGRSYYKTGTFEDNKTQSNGFFATELYAEYRLAPLNSVLTGLSVGIGVGDRLNFIPSGERSVGHDAVAPSVIYPAFRVGAEF